MSTQPAVSVHVPLHPRELLRRVAEAHFCAPKDVLGHGRQKEASQARVLLYLLLHQECRWPPELIAAKMGRDRSTVSAGITQARKRLLIPEGAALYRWVCGQEPTLEPGFKVTEDKAPTSHNRTIPLPHGERVAER